MIFFYSSKWGNENNARYITNKFQWKQKCVIGENKVAGQQMVKKVMNEERKKRKHKLMWLFTYLMWITWKYTTCILEY